MLGCELPSTLLVTRYAKFIKKLSPFSVSLTCKVFWVFSKILIWNGTSRYFCWKSESSRIASPFRSKMWYDSFWRRSYLDQTNVFPPSFSFICSESHMSRDASGPSWPRLRCRPRVKMPADGAWWLLVAILVILSSLFFSIIADRVEFKNPKRLEKVITGLSTDRQTLRPIGRSNVYCHSAGYHVTLTLSIVSTTWS